MKKIFLSYSSKINKSVEALIDDLSDSPNYELWIDKKLSGGQQWWDEILARIRACDIFILALSQDSHDSVACTLEYSYALRLGKHILPVTVDDNVNMKLLLSELRTVHFFNYSNLDRREAGKLINTIFVLPTIETLPNPLPNSPEVPIQSKAHTVFLGYVTDDLDEERATVKSYLHQYGIYVLPNTCYSLDPSLETTKFKLCTEKDLSECAAFVQLLSVQPGKKPEGSSTGYLQLQYEIARNSGKALFQWRSPYLDINTIQDTDHQALVNGDKVRSEGIEDFKRTVKEFVLNPPAVKPSQANQNLFVFVNRTDKDRLFAKDVCGELLKHGIGWYQPIDSDDPSAIRKDLEERSVNSQGIIFIYGCSDSEWIRNQFELLIKTRSYHKKPLHSFAICEGPPEEKRPINMGFPNLQLLDLKKGMDEQQLAAFVDRLVKENA